jgi:hypothetical protein
MSKRRNYEVGDVVQIIETHGRNGWIGAFVMVTEVKSFGIQGFVTTIKSHEEQTQAYIRLPWNQFEYVGKATLTPNPNPSVHKMAD